MAYTVHKDMNNWLRVMKRKQLFGESREWTAEEGDWVHLRLQEGIEY